MRALARQLEQGAQGALEGAKLDGAADDAENGASSAARARRRSAPLRAAPPTFAAADVDALIVRAQEASDGIRSARTLASPYADWDAVLGSLGRMKLLLVRSAVEAPSAHAVGALSGSSLLEFRQLAHDVEVRASEAHQRAKREVRDYPERGQQYLGELLYFAVQSRDLRRLADAPEVDPQRIGPIVDRLLEDARKADREMRDAREFTSVWVGSGSTITMLHRMAQLVRS